MVHIYIDVVLRVLYELERVLNVALIQLIYNDFLLQVFVYGSNRRSTLSVMWCYVYCMSCCMSWNECPNVSFI